MFLLTAVSAGFLTHSCQFVIGNHLLHITAGGNLTPNDWFGFPTHLVLQI